VDNREHRRGVVLVTNSADEPRLRADARRNRETLLQAAEQLLRETAGNLRIEELASRSGVGVGTIYRNLGDRDQIIETVILLCNERALTALIAVPLDTDAWTAFEAAANVIVDNSFGNLWNPQLIGFVDRTSPRVHAVIAAFVARASQIIARAQAEGVVRSDIEPRDIMDLLARIVRDVIPDGRSEADMRAVVQRMLRVVLDGLRHMP
jgi:AcrR family transcriptional regulator